MSPFDDFYQEDLESLFDQIDHNEPPQDHDQVMATVGARYSQEREW